MGYPDLLVGGFNPSDPSEKYESVAMKLPTEWKVIKFHGSKPPTSHSSGGLLITTHRDWGIPGHLGRRCKKRKLSSTSWMLVDLRRTSSNIPDGFLHGFFDLGSEKMDGFPHAFQASSFSIFSISLFGGCVNWKTHITFFGFSRTWNLPAPCPKIKPLNYLTKVCKQPEVFQHVQASFSHNSRINPTIF